MKLKTKSNEFECLNFNKSENVINFQINIGDMTHEEITNIIEDANEIETITVDDTEYSGFTDFIFVKSREDPVTKKITTYVQLAKPDLTTDKLKAAITYLGLMNGNTEVTEVLNE